MKIFIIILLLLVTCSNNKKYDKSVFNPVDSVTIEEIEKEKISFFVQFYINLKTFIFDYMPFVKGCFRNSNINSGDFFGFYWATSFMIGAYLGLFFFSWTVLALLFYILHHCNLYIFGWYPFKHRNFTLFIRLFKKFLLFISKMRNLSQSKLNDYGDDDNIAIYQFFFFLVMILLFIIPFMPLFVLIYYLLKWLNKKYDFIHIG